MKIRGALSLLLLLVLGTTADASVTVRLGNGQIAEPEQATVELNPLTGGYDVTLLELYNPGGITKYTIRGNGGETIDNVYIDVPCFSNPDGDCSLAGSPTYVEIFSDAPGGIHTIHNVEQREEAEVYLLDVHATHDIGSVSAHSVGRVIAGDTIHGPIVGTITNPIFGVFWVEADHVLGDVLAPNGRIGLVYGHVDIGAPGAPVTIEAKHFINQIAALGPAYANVNARANGGTGRLFSFYADGFVGSLEIEEIMNDQSTGTHGHIWIDGDLEGVVRIGKGFDDPDHFIQLPLGGISGQIIINADDAPGEGWSAPVYLGLEGDPNRVTITGPDDGDLPGGGAIGVAPFDLLPAQCEPAYGDVLELGGALATVRLRHSGPVRIEGPVPATAGRRLSGSVGPFAPVSTKDFTFEIANNDANTLKVTGPFEADYEYRLQATSHLVSDLGHPGDPAVEWAGDYRVHVTGGKTPCHGDVNDSGFVDLADLLAVLSNWGAIGGPNDLDGNGIVALGDLLEVLSNWGPC